MKKTVLMLSVALALVGCGAQKETGHKSLIVYYSQTGATQQVAELLQTQTGADILRIDALQPYDGDFQQTIERCLKEKEAGVLPELAETELKVTDYDTIFIGYPIWFGTYAPPMARFLKENNLAGKVLIPFCTFGSGGLETGMADLKAAQPEAVVMDGFGIRNARLACAKAELSQFLMRYGIIEGEADPLPEYDEQAPLSEQTQAIFDEATAGYPMPLGKAVSVASSPDGEHFLFAAEGLGPDGQVASTLVFVLRLDGQKAEFTRVQR